MAATSDTASSPAIRSLVPARIDRLPWSRFHAPGQRASKALRPAAAIPR